MLRVIHAVSHSQCGCMAHNNDLSINFLQAQENTDFTHA